MDLLVDTHIILWYFFEPEKMSQKVKNILTDTNNTIYYSVVSMWEVAIKHKIGKLGPSGTEFMHYCEQAGFKKLPFDDRHVVALETLEKKPDTPPHNDPFDQGLLAQAKYDCMMLLSHDQKFSYYDEPYITIV